MILLAVTHAPVGRYSHTQVMIGLGVLATLVVTLLIFIWRRGRKG